MSKPEIRLKGFEGEWGYSLLGSLASVYDGIHQTPNYVDKGVMFLSVENISSLTSNKYISEEDFRKFYKFYPERGDILMTRIGDVGTPHVVETTEKVAYYVSLALLKLKDIDPYYLSSCIQSPTFQYNLKQKTLTTAIPMKINKEEIGKVQCVYTKDKKEQKAIATYFRSLDSMILSTTKKIASLKQMKSASLISMFPQGGEVKPRVRFEGFEGEWEYKSFEKLYYHNVIKNDLSFGVDKVISVANMYFNPNTNISDPNYLRTYNIFRLGDIAFEGNKSKSFAHGRFVENIIGDGIVSHVFEVFSPINQDYDLNYWRYAINNERIMGKVLMRCTKASTMMTNLVAKDFLKEKILVPSYEEQKKIGSFFVCLDKQISLQEQRLEKLKQIKSACLDKMFV